MANTVTGSVVLNYLWPCLGGAKVCLVVVGSTIDRAAWWNGGADPACILMQGIFHGIVSALAVVLWWLNLMLWRGFLEAWDHAIVGGSLPYPFGIASSISIVHSGHASHTHSSRVIKFQWLDSLCLTGGNHVVSSQFVLHPRSLRCHLKEGSRICKQGQSS